jgi:hypothetical protein
MRGRGPTRYALALAALLAAFYGAWIALWVWHPVAYQNLMQLWGIHPVYARAPAYAEQPLPFFDLEGVISWSECARRGIDVYASNPCDPAPYHRTANYSPLLVDLPLQWIGTRHTLPAGLAMNAIFLALLPFVLRPRSWKEFGIAAAACLSGAVLYAVERANIDVFVFSLIALAILVPQRTLRGRLWLYGAAAAGTLIKFYPVVFLGMMLREKPRVFLLLGLAFAMLFGAYAVWYWPAFARIGANLPYYHPFSDMFGAAALPISTARAFGLPPAAAVPMLAALLAGAAFAAFRLARMLPDLRWDEPGLVLFAAGCFVNVSCFVLQTNNSYRAIFLLFVIPGLFALTRQARDAAQRHVLVLAQVALLGCLWAEAWRRNQIRILNGLFGHAPRDWLEQAPDFVFVFVRETMWWFLMTVLAAGLICFVRQTTMALTIRKLVSLQTSRSRKNDLPTNRSRW